MFLHAPNAAAQQTLEERYQKAIQSFNEAKMEDACELFQQIEKDSPNYKETRTHLNPACDSAKRTYALEEKLFNEGVDLFKQGQVDDAKQKLSQASGLVLKHPKYRTQIEGYLKQIEARSGEEASFQHAVELFNQGNDDEAAKQFSQIEQGKGARSNDARKYLQRITDRREESAWNRAVELYARGDSSGARPLFEEVIRMNGKHAGEAQTYLGKMNTANSDQRAFGEAVKAFNEKRYPDASARFHDLIQKGSPHAAEAQSYLQRIETVLKQEADAREQAQKRLQTGQDPKEVAQQFVVEARADMTGGQYLAALEKLKAAQSLDPANRDIGSMLSRAQELADEAPLRQGLAAYFEGKYDEAERELGEYVEARGRKLSLAYFFRGAVRASRYFLSGERDTQQKELALADFRALSKDSRQFQPPKQYVPAKILSLYSQAVAGGSQ